MNIRYRPDVIITERGIIWVKLLVLTSVQPTARFAYMLAGKPEVISNAEGNRTTPSVVAVNKKGERLVGQVAQRQRVTNPKNTIYGVKRLIGRKFDDKEVQKDLDIMPYKIVKKGTGVAVEMGDKEYTPEEVSAMILSKIKADAEAFLGEKVTEAVDYGASLL